MSYISSYFHCIFSTKERHRFITPELRDRLWPFMGGIARQNKMKAIEIGGVEDHIHILLSLPSTMAISKALQLMKGGSSKWIHETFPRTPAVCAAGRIRCIQSERVATGQNHRLHQRTESASPQDDVSGGISGVAEKTSHRIRRTVFVKMRFSRPCGTHSSTSVTRR
jgi:REP element-mobilizing transposase RayT